MNKFFDPEKKEWEAILERPTKTVADIEQIVEQIFREVKTGGDSSVRKYAELFDGFNSETFEVSSEEIEAATGKVSKELKAAIALAKENIGKFHAAQKTEKVSVETVAGVKCWQEKRPIQKVGLYIPGGTAPLFSTILMLAVPAQIAGCKDCLLYTSPSPRDRQKSRMPSSA